MFSDLECDYINPIDLCNKLNQVRGSDRDLRAGKLTTCCPLCARHTPIPSPQFVLPEMIAHAFLTLLFLLSGQWLAFLVNAPLVGYNVNKCVLPRPRALHPVSRRLGSR